MEPGDGGRAGRGEPAAPQGLDAALAAAGVSAGTRPAATVRSAGRLRLVGRALLRLIAVDPDRCPSIERPKFYLMAVIVVANAALAATTFPTGLAAGYRHLSPWAMAWVSLLGAVVIGAIDALIVGMWVYMTKQWLRPTAETPKMPGWGRRLALFVVRAGLTVAIAFVLGQMLTWTMNTTAIAKQLHIIGIRDRARALATAVATDNQVVATNAPLIVAAQKQVDVDTAIRNYYLALASCEGYGTLPPPPIPGRVLPTCTGHTYPGALYHSYLDAANGVYLTNLQNDEAALAKLQDGTDQARQEITVLNNPPADQKALAALPATTRTALANIAAAGDPPQGIGAERAAFGQYASANGWSFWDRNLIGLLILALDLVPVFMKLVMGTTVYEAAIWKDDHRQALAEQDVDGIEEIKARANRDLAEKVSERWVKHRDRQMATYLETTGPVPEAASAGPDPAEAEGETEEAGETGEATVTSLMDQLRQRAVEAEAEAARLNEQNARDQRSAAAALAAEKARREEIERRLVAFVGSWALEAGYAPRRDLVDEFGAGGYVMGAQRESDGMLVVIKGIWTWAPRGRQGDFSDTDRARLLREIERLRQKSNHPNVVPLLDVLYKQDIIGLVMPYFANGDLRALRDSVPAITLRRVVEIGQGIASGIEYLHSPPNAMVHRDIKPRNVLIDDDGQPRITDFGTARRMGTEPMDVTGDGKAVGTEWYMSPQQAVGQEVGPEADVRGWGAIIYMLLTGWAPLAREARAAGDHRHPTLVVADRAMVPAPVTEISPCVPQALSDLVSAALAYDPADRPTAAEILAVLAALPDDQLDATIDYQALAAAPQAEPVDVEAPTQPRPTGMPALPPARINVDDEPPTAEPRVADEGGSLSG